MDGNTFQCFGINYQTNRVHLGTKTVLRVLPGERRGIHHASTVYNIHVPPPLPPIEHLSHSYSSFTCRSSCSRCPGVDYTQFSVGPVNTTIGWTYRNLTCQPTVFMVEGYNDTATITTGQPVLTLNSTSTMTLLPNISTVPLYLRLLAYDETGTSCAEDSATRYYIVDSNGEIYVTASQ